MVTRVLVRPRSSHLTRIAALHCLLVAPCPVFPTAGPSAAKKLEGLTARVENFMDALLHAKQVPIEGGCELLILPDTASGKPVHWLNMRSNTLFVRPVFKEFYEKLLQAFSDDVIPRRRNKLLRGVPGIGKSSFGQ